MVYFGEEISDFRLCYGGWGVGVVQREFKLTLRNLNLPGNESKPLFVVRPITIGKGAGGVAQESVGCRRVEG